MIEKAEDLSIKVQASVGVDPVLTDATSEDPREATATGDKVSRLRGIFVIFTLSGLNFLNTMGSGILIAALPRIASDVGLSNNLILVRLPLKTFMIQIPKDFHLN